MNKSLKLILKVAAITFVVVICLAGAAFGFMMYRMSTVQAAPVVAGATPGYGPGQGRGPGMMGGRGPGGMMGGGQASLPEGAIAPASGSGGLTAATADGKPIAAVANAPKLPENTATAKAGNQTVTLTLSAYPPSSFQLGTFDVKLTDDKGQPVNDAQVSLDLTMPGMWMPPSAPAAQSLGNGAYRAQAFWTMRGLWLIEVKVQRAGATQSAFFTVWL